MGRVQAVSGSAASTPPGVTDDRGSRRARQGGSRGRGIGQGADAIKGAIEARGAANVVVATGASQFDMLAALVLLRHERGDELVACRSAWQQDID